MQSNVLSGDDDGTTRRLKYPFRKKTFCKSRDEAKINSGKFGVPGWSGGVCVCVASPCKVWPDWANFETSG